MRLASVLILFFYFSLPLNAAVYKTVDENGNVSYTDKPQENSEALKLRGLSTYRARTLPQGSGRGNKEIAEKVFNYSRIQIVIPGQEETIWDNSGAFRMQVSIEPELQTDLGHKILFFLNGSKQGQASVRDSIRLVNVSRGEHSVYARIVDEKGETIKQSDAVTFFLQRQSVNHPARKQ
ncbi:MAG: DUF4124 domain-containing protein [Gammaproteobacteria bacterium]